MGDKTGIEWTDATWNPVSGCSKVSPGCAHCYAETVADRFWATQYPTFRVSPGEDGEGMCGPDYSERPRRFTDVMCHTDRLDQPLRWKKPRRVFVNSMSDLFHEDVPDAFIDKVFAVMALAPQHTFQVLTKRAERMRAYCLTLGRYHEIDRVSLAAKAMQPDGSGFMWTLGSNGWHIDNVWLGVSVENQRWADARIPLLLQTPAAIRFISAEPLLGPMDLGNLRGGTFDAMTGCGDRERLTTWEDTPRLDWVIVGGESGPGARPCRVQWVRDIVAQCRAASVPVFVKQLGAKPEGDPRPPERRDPVTGARILTVMQAIEIRDRKGGDPSEWPEDLRVREYPEVRA
jgi:protein gp37